MFIRSSVWALAATLSLIASGFVVPTTAQAADGNVILITLDGVRWQELFRGTDKDLGKKLPADEKGEIFTSLWHHLFGETWIFGDHDRRENARVANDPIISLPAYQSIFAGEEQPCKNNDCDRISVETFPERVRRELRLPREKVASIASWENIHRAVEHVEGTVFSNAGVEPLLDGGDDPERDAINHLQATMLPPWEHARSDEYTFAHAMHFIKKHEPRFLYVSLNDSDEWGHKGKYRNYVSTLRKYDRWIEQLTDLLKGMGDYGANTTLIVTTDHGRGNGWLWRLHYKLIPRSKYIWIYASTPATREGVAVGTVDRYTHLDLRPTIESVLGLTPKQCKKCGGVIAPLVVQPRSSSVLH